MKMPKIETGHVDKMMVGEFTEGVKKLRKENERSLEKLEQAMVLWISNIEGLENKVPHDDVVVDTKTLSYNVLMCAWKAKLMELEGLREELEQAEEQLDLIEREESD